MYITRRQSQIIAVATLVAFFVIGAWFTRSASHPRREPMSSPERTQTTPSPTPPPPSAPNSELSSDAPHRTAEIQENVAATQAPQHSEELPSPPEQSNEETRFRLEEFHRSETRDGKMIWEIFGKNARYITDQNAVAIDDCHLKFFARDGKEIDLRSGSALVFLSGAELKNAELRDGVKLLYDNSITVKTTEADFDRTENRITSDQFVTISGGWYDFQGTGLLADLTEETLALHKEIKSTFDPSRRTS